ncbi:NAD-dependent epimerase/dehydratase family protein [Streptococcus suis]
MKILVTGANGYLGSGVVKVLLDNHIEVVATDFASNNIDNRAEVIVEDLFTIENPYNFFGKPDVLLHMAWRDGFIHDSENHILDIPKHYQFLDKMLKEGLSHLAVLGSMHEIGFFEGAIKESTPTNPQNLYGISKDSLRNITKLLCEKNGATWQWLRGFYIVGNTNRGSSIFSKIIQATVSGKEVFPFTSGKNQFDFLDYRIFCEQVTATVLQNEVDGVINICSGFPDKLSNRVEQFIRENNLDIALDYGAFPDRPYDSKAVWGDDSKISKIMKVWRTK